MFKQILMAACLALPFAAIAAEEKKEAPQQKRMTTCNKEAGDKKLAGDERKAFMKQCLSGGDKGGEKSAAPTKQQEKMASCNKEAGAKSLKGDDRKKFMSECLKAA